MNGFTDGQKPSVGRIVHYFPVTEDKVIEGQEPLAAIMTIIHPNSVVGLVIFNPSGHTFNQSIPYSEEPKQGSWSWPKLV